MKIVQINATCGVGSTGKIVLQVSKMLNSNNVENYVLYSSGQSNDENAIKYASDKDLKLQALRSRVLGNYGFNSVKMTKNLISKLKEINPDIVHLHNLHSHNCNLELLFNYFKQSNIKLFWTFHDCWAMTGYCPSFDMIGCNKWKTTCDKCLQTKGTTWFFDRSRKLFNKKKELFSGLDLTIITPSNWLANMVKQSFFKDYPVKVIHNGIDLDVFKPAESNFRQIYNIENKFIILGVAFGWGKRKGLDVFIELAKRLDKNYQIVLVGTTDKVDKLLPDNIISIHRTQNQKQLAEIYSAADVFVNPTREEVLGLVNLESLACGTPVITFNTGGSPECIDNNCGIVIEKDNIDAIEKAIIKIEKEKLFDNKDCIKRAKEFDANIKFNEYVNLYKVI